MKKEIRETTDGLGNILIIGDFVVYPIQKGHSVTMRVGELVKINGIDDIITSFRITSIGIDINEKPVRDSKKTSSVNKFENIIKIDNLPQNFTEMIKD